MFDHDYQTYGLCSILAVIAIGLPFGTTAAIICEQNYNEQKALQTKTENTSVITFEDGAIDVINSYIDRNNNQTIYISLLTEEQYEELKESDYVKIEPITAFFTEEDYQKYNNKSFTEEDLNEIINQINSEFNGEALSLTNN